MQSVPLQELTHSGWGPNGHWDGFRLGRSHGIVRYVLLVCFSSLVICLVSVH